MMTIGPSSLLYGKMLHEAMKLVCQSALIFCLEMNHPANPQPSFVLSGENLKKPREKRAKKVNWVYVVENGSDTIAVVDEV
jgi:hypothetical protein